MASRYVPSGADVAVFVSQKWGRPVRAVPLQTFAILTTPIQIAKNNPRRFELEVFNIGTGNVWILNDATVTTSLGILVSPLGGSVIIAADEDGELSTYPWYAVAPATGNTVLTLEIESI